MASARHARTLTLTLALTLTLTLTLASRCAVRGNTGLGPVLFGFARDATGAYRCVV